ncbi:acyl-CoA dehydrogenase [Rhodovarius crocodyli]|uniref:Acyl-CoA dehydrogenase n=1 Tax=Rhodovarius crocodyli TaxID=1979269 RepID=A0A437MEH1_9PROT|nr:acyl-CoA dehydrogenase family protein [Rhodovarius crocodyli]RVT96037.1 acyl-CoA dehydrogenase [Rhodovarius crocodyli]
MSEIGEAIAGQIDRLLNDGNTPARLRRLEGGEWLADTWAALEEMGLPLALVPEEVGLSWADAAAIWQVLGRHGAPVPMGEAMLANALLASPVEGVVTLGDRAAPFGRFAAHALTETGLHAVTGHTPGLNLAREPRDALVLGPATGAGAATLRLGLALLRAALMAGAARHALNLAVEWANTRKQFGRPIGKFQAIQQELAVVAGEVAALETAVGIAARAVDAHGLAGAGFEIGCAKVIAGEAAEATARRVHQVFAAIGITEEHELHHFTRRLWSWRDEGGSERAWAAEIGAQAIARGGAALWADITSRDVRTA